MEYYPSITNEEILPFAGIWMDLEGIMLSKTNQTRRTIIKLFNLHVKYIKRIKFIEKKDQTCGYLRQKVREGKNGGIWSKGTDFQLPDRQLLGMESTR